MMLAKNATREREIAVRLALGSGRSRVVRQLMVEALVLALAGGALGTLVGFWLTSFATPERLGIAMIDLEFQPSAAVLLFSVGLTAAATVVVGLFPALRFSRPELVSSLKDDAGCGGKRVGRLHRVAASAQVGIALGFLVTCSLFVRATWLVDEQGFGFDPDKLVLTRVQLPGDDYGSVDEEMALLDRLKASVQAVPGVRTVSLADGIPLDLSGNFGRVSRAERGGRCSTRLRGPCGALSSGRGTSRRGTRRLRPPCPTCRSRRRVAATFAWSPEAIRRRRRTSPPR